MGGAVEIDFLTAAARGHEGGAEARPCGRSHSSRLGSCCGRSPWPHGAGLLESSLTLEQGAASMATTGISIVPVLSLSEEAE